MPNKNQSIVYKITIDNNLWGNIYVKITSIQNINYMIRNVIDIKQSSYY